MSAAQPRQVLLAALCLSASGCFDADDTSVATATEDGTTAVGEDTSAGPSTTPNDTESFDTSASEATTNDPDDTSTTGVVMPTTGVDETSTGGSTADETTSETGTDTTTTTGVCPAGVFGASQFGEACFS